MRRTLRTLALAALGFLSGSACQTKPAGTPSAQPIVIGPAMSPVLDDARAAGDPAGCKDQTPTTWDIEMAPSEPGERLVITGRVLAGARLSPVAGVTVYVYHADAKGNYALPHEKEGPRLCGILRTNEKGEYRIRTSMPGGYDGYAPHVHFEISGAGIKRQYAFVNLLLQKGPPPGAPVAGVDLSRLAQPVYRGADQVLHCTRDLVIEVPRWVR